LKGGVGGGIDADRRQTEFSGGAKQSLGGGIIYKNNVFLIFLGGNAPLPPWLRAWVDVKSCYILCSILTNNFRTTCLIIYIL